MTQKKPIYADEKGKIGMIREDLRASVPSAFSCSLVSRFKLVVGRGRVR
ncbi:MAG: hypothetical protein J7M34_04530 [Anaerolineae bacterium]|nr:hypothetical protein [Anaerolineae bacterium]